MKKHTFDLDSLNFDDVLSTDEMVAIDAGATASTSSTYSPIFSTDAPQWNMHGEAIWSMIP